MLYNKRSTIITREEMGEDNLYNKIKILFDIEDKQMQNDLDKNKLAELRNEALIEFRKNSNKGPVKKKRRRSNALKAAASIILLAACSIAFYQISQKNKTDYSDLDFDTQKNQTNTETSLILADGSKIEIESENSILTYDKLGEHIEIDSVKTIDLNKKRSESANKKAFNTLVVPYGKQSRIVLSDGSTVWLNAGSQLMYPPKFDNNKRIVYLSGEAYFEIVKNEGKPFIVETSGIQVDVLGTAFNVTAYHDDPNIEIILARGSVEINTTGSNFLKQSKLALKPGQLASYSKETKIVNTQNVDVTNYISWMEGYFLCRKIPLNKLLMKLSRFYNVEIELEDELTKVSTFSGKLENKENITKVLDVINETIPINYTVLDNKLMIRPINGN